MLMDVAVVLYGIFKKYMNPNSYVHGEKDGSIHVYDIDIPAEEIYAEMEEKEKGMLEKYGWKIIDGEFIKKS